MKAAILGLILLTGAQHAVGIGNDNPPAEGGGFINNNTNNIGIIQNPQANADSKSTSISGSNSESKSTSISGANSDSKSTQISGDSTSIGIGVGGDSKSFATGGDSKSFATGGDSKSNAIAGDSTSYSKGGNATGGVATAGDQSAKSGDVSVSIQGDTFPEIAQSAASIIAQSCQEGQSGQGISQGISAVFDSAQCTYIRQASVNLGMQQMYYAQGMDSSADLYLQRAVGYIDKANTATDVTAPARAIGGIAVSLLPIAALIFIF